MSDKHREAEKRESERKEAEKREAEKRTKKATDSETPKTIPNRPEWKGPRPPNTTPGPAPGNPTEKRGVDGDSDAEPPRPYPPPNPPLNM